VGQGRVPGAGMESRLRGWMSFCKHLADERGRHADPQNLARAVIGRRDPCASGYPSYGLATSASKEPCPVPVERSTVHTRFQIVCSVFLKYCGRRGSPPIASNVESATRLVASASSTLTHVVTIFSGLTTCNSDTTVF
jgi:hypothetical protein